MANKEGMIFKFFEKWKQNKLNKFAEKMLKDNPTLEKDLRKLDAGFAKLKKELDNR